MSVLKFPIQNLKSLHFFTENLDFPIAIATYDDWQETQVSYLSNHFYSQNFNSEFLCKWCISHNISYQILYPLGITSVVKNPYKYFKYLQLKKKLNNSL